jgi:methanogenic corrinoid protein MtbC1
VIDLAARTVLARALVADVGLGARVTDLIFARHPEWDLRFGAAGRRRCTEDAGFHLSFLAGAVQAGCPELFVEYVTWCADMLAAHDVSRAHLSEHLELLEQHVHREPDPERLVRRTINAARVALDAAAAPAGAVDDATPARVAYLSAVLAGRRAEAWEATREARRQGASVEQVYREILLWGQRRLGELWAAAKITVAQEHMASAVTQSVVARMYSEITNERDAGRLLLAGVEGELHVLPAQLAADLLELEGWDVAFVGTHVPLASVLAAIESEHPDVLGLSTTMVSRLPGVVELVTAVRARFPGLPIVLGGRAARGAAALGEELGVAVDVAGDGAALRPYAKVRRG